MADVKLKDIAQIVGVSAVTVSNALSGKSGVSSEIRAKIEKTARELGYNLSKYENKNDGFRIGVIASELYLEVGISFYWAMYQQVAYAASKTQSVTMLEVLNKSMQENGELPKLIREKAVDGLIIIGWHVPSYIEKLVKESDIPVVLLDFQIKGLKCDSVMSSNYIGMYKMTKYLINNGHRKIAFIGSIFANENIMDRYYGYKKALLEAGIKENPDWLLEDRILETNDMNVKLPKEMPTAFVCNCDYTAGYLYDLLTDFGYKIPDDISIVGYDNYLLGHKLSDEITTYNVDMKRMAKSAMKILIEKIRGIEKHSGTRYIDGEIIERSSVKVQDCKL